MKKILLLLPIIGICSSLFAQAPQVRNVQAQQTGGTKEVQINFECSAKAGESFLNFEVWFRQSPSDTQWERALSISKADGSYLAVNYEVDELGLDRVYSHRLDGITDYLQAQNLIWDAGIDAPDVSADSAQIKVITFYNKTDEFGGSPVSAQVSGWDGIDNGDGSTAGTDTNGTTNELDVYYLTSTQVGDVTSYTREIADYYVFEAFYDEPAEHNGFVGTEVKQLIAVYDDAGTWRHDSGIGPWALNPSIFPDLDSVGIYIENNSLVSQGKLTYSDPAAGAGN